MGFSEKKKTSQTVTVRNQEYIANTYFMRCFNVTMIIYAIIFLLNLANIFIIDQKLMRAAFFPSVCVYVIMCIVTRFLTLSNSKTKYVILASTVLVFTISGVFLTYHVIVLPILTFLYATLYSSKKVMKIAYVMSVVSTVIVVYAGYFFGLCDANMALLTTTCISNYTVGELFALNEINPEPWISLLVFYITPRCIIYVAFMSVCNSLVEIVSTSRKKTERLSIRTITALSDAVDAKDRYTSGHSKRVAKYSKMIAERLGKSKEEQDEIYRAGLLHDIGKIRIPEEIINKPSRLTDEEYNIIKIHPVTGYHILWGITDDNHAAVAAKHHHERYDGKGYPNGLAGNEIPEIARIIGVADAYDAMASNRSYRDALPQEVVREEIRKGKGTQFDPQMADIMLQLIDEDKDYTMKENASQKRRILVVDHEEKNIEEVEAIMKEEPRYEIVGLTSGLEALERIDGETFDLILLDRDMSEVKCLDILKHIREEHKTPVVLMSDDKTVESSRAFKKLGFDDYMSRPLQPLLVREIIHNMTEKLYL